jgi:Zn-dependent peptidase ImmA (M78 family)
MALRTDAYYKQLADDAIAKTGVSEPPIPVTSLADRYGIPVRRVEFPDFFSGAIVNEDGLPVILLNDRKDEDAQRATLAHLVGHVLIVLGDPGVGYPRNTKMEHTDANLVADELVMPSSMVSDQAAKWFNDHRYLARLFGVEESEMMRKMMELGIIKQHGIMWDY